MSLYADSDWSRLSTSTLRSRRSGKSLVEKIRELGFNIKSKNLPSTWETAQCLDVKTEYNQSWVIKVMSPASKLEVITYYQPVKTFDEDSLGRNIYKIEKFQTKSVGPKEIRKISDIEVKSYRPTKKIKFKKKKRYSSLTSRIEVILNRKNLQLSRDPSEESVELNLPQQPPKQLNDLPEGILQRIFLFLTQKERALTLARVCKSWYYMLKDPIFWKELEFVGARVHSSIIIHLLKTHLKLEKLTLTSVPDVVKILQELCRCNHGIKKLGIKYCTVGNLDFIRIIFHVVSCCTNLEVLELKGMSFHSESFYLELGRLKNLRKLNLSGNKLLRSQDLITISINCRNLQDLRILDINQDNSLGVALKDDDVVIIISHLEKNLNTLKLDMQQLGNISYQAILKCTGLKCLALKNCLHLSSDMFRRFPILSQLKYLKISRAINLKPDDFQWVFCYESMQNIRDLDIDGCWGVGSIGLYGITKGLSSLSYLSLKNCKSIQGNDLVFLANCSKLRGLNLAFTNVGSNHLNHLPKYTKNLEELTIDGSMFNKSDIRALKWLRPSLKIKLSLSQYKNDEQILTDF